MCYLVLLKHLLLLQPFYSYNLIRLPLPAQPYLTKRSFPYHSQRFKVISTNFGSPASTIYLLLPQQFGLLLEDLIAYLLFLFFAQPHIVDLFLKHGPVVTTILLHLLQLRISWLVPIGTYSKCILWQPTPSPSAVEST